MARKEDAQAFINVDVILSSCEVKKHPTDWFCSEMGEKKQKNYYFLNN